MPGPTRVNRSFISLDSIVPILSSPFYCMSPASGYDAHGMTVNAGNGWKGAPDVTADVRWIEVDLSDLGLPADMPTLDDLAAAAAHVYERFVTYADEGWEWLTYPASREFDGWVTSERAGRRILTAATS